MKRIFILMLLPAVILLNGCSEKTDSIEIKDYLFTDENSEWIVEEEQEINDVTISKVSLLATGEGIPEPLWANGGINVDFSFPQISSPCTPENTRVNLMILDVLWKSFGEEVRLEHINELLTGNVKTGILSAVAVCEVLGFADSKLSLKFESKTSTASRISLHTKYITINTATGVYESLFDSVDKSGLIAAVRNGAYIVLEGAYTGGWQAVDMNDSFADAMLEETSELRKAELYAHLPDSWENGHSEQEITLDKKVYHYNEFNPFDVESFGTDQQYIYFTFSFEDSLNSYIALKVALEDIGD